MSPNPPTLDSHQHFWHYKAEEYGWIGENDTRIRRDFLPGDLEPELRAAGIEGCIAVQARQTIAETRWLLSLAADNDFIRGVVGWIPLTGDERDVASNLERFAALPKLRGLRHGLQGEPDGYALSSDFNAGIARLAGLGLVYDLLIVARQLPDAIALVDRHPNQSFVLDHLAKPKIVMREIEPWATDLRNLSRRENVVCKISGLTTEADRESWTETDLRPYLEIALDAFGPDRLMFGSDWPVCTLACSYGRWAEIVRNVIRPLAAGEQAAILGGTAARVYGIDGVPQQSLLSHGTN